MAKPTHPCPTEAQEQRALFDWAERLKGKYPELALLYHVPNEGKRSVITGARLRSEGLRRGVPDLCLPVARNGYHGLYIELKRKQGGRLTEDQERWIDALIQQGYCATVCKGWTEAALMIVEYLGGKTIHDVE